MSVERQLFPQAARHESLRRLLLAQDGSTTRTCSAMCALPVQVLLHHQHRTVEVPRTVAEQLGGTSWLERVTSLVAGGNVLMDNLSYTRLDAVPDWFLRGLDEGAAPIGHLLARLFVQRQAIESEPALEAGLWKVVGLPDSRASRAYRIVTPEGPLMLIFEVFRGGLVPQAEPALS
jgi:chorismate-pyruvate lyase